MRLGNLVMKAWDVGGHVVATGLGIDAFINATQGNYKMAAVEAIVSAGIEVAKYLDRKKQRVVSEFCERVPAYVVEANRINREFQEAFERLFAKLDYQ